MHTIRLRGPWQLEAIERYVTRDDGRYHRSTDGLPLSARMTMPADWSEAFGRDFLGRIRYRRLFQKPTGLETGQRVWLVVEPPRSCGVVSLNDQPLGDIRFGRPSARFDITTLLEDHNHLEITVEHPLLDHAGAANDDSNTDSPGGLIDEVRLEIEE